MSLNAIRHGLASTRPLLLPGEDPDAYGSFMDSVFECLRPSSLVESIPVAQIGDTAWRLERLNRIEHGLVLARLEEEVTKTEVFKNFSLLLRAQQAVDALATTVENSSPPAHPHALFAFASAGQSVLAIVHDVDGLPLAAVEEIVHALDELDSNDCAQQMGHTFTNVGLAAKRLGQVLSDRVNQGSAEIQTVRERIAAERVLLTDHDTKGIERYRRSLELSMARQLELLKAAREQVAGATAKTGPDPQEFRMKLRLVK